MECSPLPLCSHRCRFGPHTVDRFASAVTAQIPRFFSRWLNPGCEGVDCFTVNWSGENNWLCPPVYLAVDCIRHLLASRADGSLLILFWKSGVFWPLLCHNASEFKLFVIDYLLLEPHAAMFVSGSCTWNLFSGACPKWFVLVLKLCGCGQHVPQFRLSIPSA